MTMREESLRVLLVSSPGSICEAVEALLPEGGTSPMTAARSVSAARRLLLEQEFDLVLVNGPLPDDLGMRLACDVSASTNSGVVFFARQELCDEVSDRLASLGVAVLPKPCSTRELSLALQFARAAHARLLNAAHKQVSIEEKIAEIRLVNRAKWLLISNLGMSEPDAHRLIEKRSMDTRSTKREVAQEILDSYQD